MMSGSILLGLRILIIGVLYLFLFWALWLLWKDLKHRSRALMGIRVPTLFLSTEEENGQNWQFNQPQVIIGRDPACECSIDDATISARHARLSYHHSQWWLEDLQSRNGTLLNQAPVLGEVVLTSEDLLQCGRVIFQVKLEGMSIPQVAGDIK